MIWNKNHKGSIHLYGHSHANAEHTINGKSMDVGIDNAFKIFGEYRPFGFSEILHLLKDRTQLIIDHHGNKDFYDRKKIIIEHDNLINIAKH